MYIVVRKETTLPPNHTGKPPTGDQVQDIYSTYTRPGTPVSRNIFGLRVISAKPGYVDGGLCYPWTAAVMLGVPAATPYVSFALLP